MSDAFDSGGAEYLGVALDAGFYGLHVALYLFFLGVHCHIGAKPFRGVANIATSFTFALATVYLILHVTTTYIQLTSQGDPNFTLVNKIGNASSTIFTLIDFISQMLLVYRCWIIWEKRYLVVIFPTLLALTSLWSGWSVIILVNTRTFTDSLDNILGALAVASISSALAVNGVVTLTIVSRIWYISQRFRKDLNSGSHQVTKNPYSIIIAMLLESGAIVVAAQLISVVLYQIGSGGYGVVTGATTQIYAFTPTIILIRVGLGKSYDRDTKMSTVAFNHQSVKSDTVGVDVMTFGNETKSGRGGDDPEKFASE